MKSPQIFLQEDDVLSTPASALMYQCTFKVSEFLTIMQSKLLEERLFLDGMDCELLSSGKSWTKGKVIVRLEFCPDEDQIEQKALPAASEHSDSTQEYNQNSSGQIDANQNSNAGESTEINTNFPIYRHRNSNPHSVGMWS
ncbi:MAG: KGK domain-containing protein [Tychonema bourrellyi B0820]|uniref:KGK family protein n=1 Tax=Tychonema bourrellyi FEM_GT703 TaxID=2040638 RepID=A0A2G4F1Y1_9CYAN|nr:KGK domain-containing protein [Tychonema bourrellyi]MDQ2099753.1 KGK domain-containing protein [Tychonema bourrellyi B0820]PHX55774.1 KGK family protein [Tychonema bourrellyi FEM_GT703]